MLMTAGTKGVTDTASPMSLGNLGRQRTCGGERRALFVGPWWEREKSGRASDEAAVSSARYIFLGPHHLLEQFRIENTPLLG